MILNRDIAQTLERLAPRALAEDYDNVGLLVGEPEKEARAALCTLDVTLPVLKEALDKGANFVLSHHPIWFRSRKTLLGDDFASEVILFAIRNGISLYASHTNLDNLGEGVNHVIAKTLDLKETDFLLPRTFETTETKPCSGGSGMIGKLPHPLPIPDFLDQVQKKFKCQSIRYTKTKKKKIKSVAVCGGAGSFLIKEALKRKADAFLSADISYHYFFEVREEMLCLDIGHYESEQFSSLLLAEYLQRRLKEMPVYVSEINTNPILYYNSPAP